ncbi:unnamed protein product [Brassica rapa subsp. narinosa]
MIGRLFLERQVQWLAAALQPEAGWEIGHCSHPHFYTFSTLGLSWLLMHDQLQETKLLIQPLL